MSEYNVVLLVEQAFTAKDATNLRGLHEDIEDPVVYHVLLPGRGRLGARGVGDGIAGHRRGAHDPGGRRRRRRHRGAAQGAARHLPREREHHHREPIEKAGGKAFGEPVTNDPIRALVAKVSEVDAREVIILTRPHVVSEFFHVDWTSRARRKLGVPVLHLLEHENFDEQAGEGEGISGF